MVQGGFMEVAATIYKITEVKNKDIKVLMPEGIVFGVEENNEIIKEDVKIKHVLNTNLEDGELCYYNSIPLKKLKEKMNGEEFSKEELVSTIVDNVNSKVVYIENSELKELEINEFEEKYNLNVDYNKHIVSEYKYSSIKDIIKGIETKILFQNDVIKRMASVIINNQYLENTKNIVLLGSKGVGKSKIVDLLARELYSPYAKIEGYNGDSLSSAYLTLFLSDDDRSGPPIVFIDGINKGIEKIRKIDGDILVEIISNIVKQKSKFPIRLNDEKTVLFDPSNINYIIALDLEKDIDMPHIVGIGNNEVNYKNNTIRKLRELLVDANCDVIDMNDLSSDNLKTILEKSEISPINEYKKILDVQNTRLRVTKKAYELIALEAYKLNKGAKGLSIITDYVMRDDIIDAQVNGKDVVFINEKKVLSKVRTSDLNKKIY